MTTPVTITIRPASALTRTEHSALRALITVAGQLPVPVHPYVWADPHWQVLVWHHATVVSHLQLTEQRGARARQPVQIGGVSQVLTHPAYRGQGYATQALRHAQHFMFTARAVDVAMLWCAPHVVPFYVQCGWQLMQAPVTVAQPHGMIVWPDLVLVLPRNDRAWTEAAMTIDGYPW